MKFGLPEEEIKRLVEFCKVGRREWLLGLEKEVEKLSDPFMTKAVRMLIDGADSDTLRGSRQSHVYFQNVAGCKTFRFRLQA